VSMTRMRRAVQVPPWDDDGRRVPWRVLSECHHGLTTGDECRSRPTTCMGIAVGVGSDVVELGVKAESNLITELVDDYGPVDDVGSLVCLLMMSSHKHARVCLS
jgi:hypothetical protein